MIAVRDVSHMQDVNDTRQRDDQKIATFAAYQAALIMKEIDNINVAVLVRSMGTDKARSHRGGLLEEGPTEGGATGDFAVFTCKVPTTSTVPHSRPSYHSQDAVRKLDE